MSDLKSLAGMVFKSLIEGLLTSCIFLIVANVLILFGIFVWQCYALIKTGGWHTVTILDGLSWASQGFACNPKHCLGLYDVLAQTSIHYVLILLIVFFYFLTFTRGLFQR